MPEEDIKRLIIDTDEQHTENTDHNDRDRPAGRQRRYRAERSYPKAYQSNDNIGKGNALKQLDLNFCFSRYQSHVSTLHYFFLWFVGSPLLALFCCSVFRIPALLNILLPD